MGTPPKTNAWKLKKIGQFQKDQEFIVFQKFPIFLGSIFLGLDMIMMLQGNNNELMSIKSHKEWQNPSSCWDLEALEHVIYYLHIITKGIMMIIDNVYSPPWEQQIMSFGSHCIWAD